MPPHPDQPDVIILGAGAAGLLAAREAGLRGRRTLVLDHNDRPGRKILISGGGRANFTNLNTTHENFLSANPHFARSALARYTPEDFLALVREHNIAFHAKTPGQLFCDGSAQQIVTMLERECATARVELRLGTTVHTVRPAAQGSGFTLETSAGPLSCQTLIVATGGLSIPKLGATGFGFELARQFGLPVLEPRPALVPLTLPEPDRAAWSDLAGLSAPAIATAGAARQRGSFRDKLLLTHRGLSGPAILQISSFWQPGEPILVDLAPDTPRGSSAAGLLAPLLRSPANRSAAAVLALLREILPTRFAERFIALHLRGFRNPDLLAFEHTLHHWQLHPDGTEGYAKAEVTAGGVDTRALDPRTLQSRAVPGLFFIGEVVDVTGWLGGYNFQWAWASGAAAGRAA